MRTVLSAIAFKHKIALLPDPTKNFLVTRCLKGIEKGNVGKVKTLPITLKILRALMSFVPNVVNDHYSRLLYSAVFCLMYFACLRIGEVAT